MTRKTANGVLPADGLPSFFFKVPFFILGATPYFTPKKLLRQKTS
jgi:hypothetical protein